MRLPAICVVGLLLAACGLSMNPDLPSTKEEGRPSFNGGDGSFDGGDGLIVDGSDLDSPDDGLGGAGGDFTLLGDTASNSPDWE